MKAKDYVNAIEKLRFDDGLAEKVRAADRGRPKFRLARAMVLAAVLTCFMIITAFGTISLFREHPAQVEILGTDTEKMSDAKYMEFTVSQMNEGMQKHYMELASRQQYHFRHGMLRDGKSGYLRVTKDYQLIPVQMKRTKLTLEKNDRTYTLDFDYIDTGSAIVSNHRSVYHKNENGELLLNLTDGNSGQWPVYFHVETGSIRDALPEWTEEDFEGRIGGAEELMGGLLIFTIVNDGLPDSRNILYWIAPGVGEAEIIEMPGGGLWYAENDTIYYQNDVGQLYCMDSNFSFVQICEYKTMGYLQDGLLPVSVRNKLGILDAYSGDLYVFQEIEASWTETLDYQAFRYGTAGTIALAHTQWRHDPERIVLCSLGVLNRNSSELNMLWIENDYDGYQHDWLDANRLAVVYRFEGRQFLCIYEFDR